MRRCLCLASLSFAALALGVSGCDRDAADPAPAVEVASPAGEGSGQAHLAVGPPGTVVLSWLEPAGDNHVLQFSSLLENRWSAPNVVAQGPKWFVNWADFPSVQPITEAIWAAHWLAHQPQNIYGYDISFAVSADAGLSWSDPAPLHVDGTPTEHGFVTLFPWRGQVGAVWLDGRNTMADGEPVFFGADGDPVGTSLQFALFDSGGNRVGSQELDELVCDCCQTDVAITAEGAVLAYRDRTTEELRDIVVRRFADDGWQAPLPLAPDNWFITGCPINGPAIAARGGEVAVAWFSAAEDQPRVKVARSSDNGRTFGAPVDVDTTGSFGHVDVALTEYGDAVVSWFKSSGPGLALSIRVVSRAGELGPIHTVAEVDTSRPLDFPQMVYARDRLVFAWTDIGDVDTVKTAIVALD